jgi:hypothetical protein
MITTAGTRLRLAGIGGQDMLLGSAAANGRVNAAPKIGTRATRVIVCLFP